MLSSTCSSASKSTSVPTSSDGNRCGHAIGTPAPMVCLSPCPRAHRARGGPLKARLSRMHVRTHARTVSRTHARMCTACMCAHGPNYARPDACPTAFEHAVCVHGRVHLVTFRPSAGTDRQDTPSPPPRFAPTLKQFVVTVGGAVLDVSAAVSVKGTARLELSEGPSLGLDDGSPSSACLGNSMLARARG